MDRRGQHVTVLRIGQRQAGNERLKPIDDRVGKDRVHSLPCSSSIRLDRSAAPLVRDHVSHPFVVNQCGPSGPIETICGQAQNKIAERGGIENRCVQNGREIRHGLFVELELLGFGGDGAQRLFALNVGFLLVGQEIRQGDPAMAPNQTKRHDTLLK